MRVRVQQIYIIISKKITFVFSNVNFRKNFSKFFIKNIGIRIGGPIYSYTIADYNLSIKLMTYTPPNNFLFR